MTDTIQWVEVPPKPHAGGKGSANRLAMATLVRHVQNRNPNYTTDKVLVARTLLTSIGSPERVAIVVDTSRGRLALRPSDVGRNVLYPRPRNSNAEVAASGLTEALGLAGRTGSVRMRAAIKDGMVLMEPIALPEPCPACGGRGVK
jgi:hypothetical protein